MPQNEVLVENVRQLTEPVRAFLKCPTPQAWLEEARRPQHLNALLVDHANCELKAAQTAIFLLRKYAVDKQSSSRLLEWTRPYEEFVYKTQKPGAAPGAGWGAVNTPTNTPTTRPDRTT